MALKTRRTQHPDRRSKGSSGSVAATMLAELVGVRTLVVPVLDFSDHVSETT